VRAGDVVLRAGTRLGPAALGVLAAAGRSEVGVARRPRAAVLGTGDELVPVEARPGPGAIRNSNAATLAAQCRAAGAVPLDLGRVADEEPALRAMVRRGLEADVLLVSGGVSRGDRDLVPAAFLAEGVEPRFHGWAVQPGGPLWFGCAGGTLVFGLPGNPAAAFVGFELLAVPVIRTRLGLPFAPRRFLRARYEGPWGRPGPRRRYRPARLSTTEDGRLVATAEPWRGSGDPFGLAAGDALAVLPEGRHDPGGDRVVDVLPLAATAGAWADA
jgi:molybdopterin molybdotransferase